ncbi:hypothetical protein OH799_26665 [Nocardia sp. NBC_00881]|uniref:hypothetical protein n=1 Tax=Nocardia sp. NBC_00881 TaxID=2975995 RepID=UPI003867E7EC|nr:hypothetical protein OH799_26665 [Nocardia sp. NBC_00881]
MTRLAAVISCVIVVAVVEAVALESARDALLIVAGIPVAVTLGWLVWSLLDLSDARTGREIDGMENGPAEMLHRWHAKAEMLADRADGTRADWDRHLRPLLAKEFELSSGQRVAKNRRAIEAAGIHQFGPELWRWVDPADSALRDQAGRAPGRAALDEILSRLQRM